MYRILAFSILFCVLLLPACANLNTISRTTVLPGKNTKQKTGKAVHLDIQQRLLIVDEMGNYCAEPSPDGLAAYAAALGISASNPSSAAASAAASGGSSAASIGLRTQSITLMRDTMFRICEAYANGAIGNAHLATLLGRSQDLTAVILAVEQLTGPLAANQAYLTSSTDAASAASLVAVAEQLELAIKLVERASDRLEEAKVQQTKLEGEVSSAEREKTAKEARLTAANNETPKVPEKILVRDAEFKSASQKLVSLNSRLQTTNTSVTLRQERYDSAVQTKDLIAQKQESAFASANAGTGGAGLFSAQNASSKISKDASIKVAETVQVIVLNALNKDYLDESCISMLTLPPKKDKQGKIIADNLFTALCGKLIAAKIEERTGQAKRDAEIAKRDAEIAKEAAAAAQQRTFKILGPTQLEKVMACVVENGAVKKNVLAGLFASKSSTSISGSTQNNLSQRNSVQLKTFLAQRPDVLSELFRLTENNPLCK